MPSSVSPTQSARREIDTQASVAKGRARVEFGRAIGNELGGHGVKHHVDSLVVPLLPGVVAARGWRRRRLPPCLPAPSAARWGRGVSQRKRRNGKFAILTYIRPMNRTLSLIAGLFGVLFLAVSAMYWFIPAGGLPSFFPGFEAGTDHIHVKHAIVSLIIALALLAFAWLQRRERL